MELWMKIGLIATSGAVLVVLALGLWSFAFRAGKEGAANRSNYWMRMRVFVQFIAILFMVFVGFMLGVLNW